MYYTVLLRVLVGPASPRDVNGLNPLPLNLLQGLFYV